MRCVRPRREPADRAYVVAEQRHHELTVIGQRGQAQPHTGDERDQRDRLQEAGAGEVKRACPAGDIGHVQVMCLAADRLA